MTQSNQSPQLTYSLENILAKLEQKIDQLDAKLEQKIDQLDAKLEQKIEKLDSKINQKIDELDSKLEQKIEKIDAKIDNLQKEVTDFKTETFVGIESVKGDIKALDEKVNGFGKRLENQEFVNRGILVALVVAILGSAAKLLGWIGNP